MRKNIFKCNVNKHFTFLFWGHDATKSIQHNLDNGKHINFSLFMADAIYLLLMAMVSFICHFSLIYSPKNCHNTITYMIKIVSSHLM